MKEIRPYRTAEEGKKILDSGGRFYNLWAKAGDEQVDASELAKAAGVFSASASAFLHLEMAIAELPADDRKNLLALLSPDLRQEFLAARPALLRPSLVESKGSAGQSTIVTGYPTFVEDRTEFRGFVVLVTPVITMIPILDVFDVYEVYDTPQSTERRTVVAITRGSMRLEGARTRFGGTLKELHFEDRTGKDHGLYLEARYFTPLA